MKRLLKNIRFNRLLRLATTLLLALCVGLNSQLVAQTKTVQANGLTLAYQSMGSTHQEAIILIGGTGMPLTAWPSSLCEELVRRGFRVISFDNRDSGLSTKFEAAGEPNWLALMDSLQRGKPAPLAYSIEDMAKDVIGLMDAVGIKKAHLAGISGGSMIAQVVAARYPTRIRSLTSMLSTSGNPALPPIKPEVQTLLLSTPPPDPADTAAIVARQVKILKAIGSPGYPTSDSLLRQRVLLYTRRSYNPSGEARQGAAALAAGDRRKELRTISVPTVVVHGSDDPIVPVEAGKEVAALIPGAQLRIISGLGYDLPLPLVQTFADAITVAAQASQQHSRK
jgi:pimeloyl-ACP methyl ester carboxylesterase